MGKKETLDEVVEKKVTECIEETKNTLNELVESGCDPSDDKVDWDLTTKDLRKLDIVALRNILEASEFAFCAMARDDNPDTKGMNNLRLQLKKIHRAINYKLAEAQDQDFENYWQLYKATKKGNQEAKEDLIKQILG